MRESKENMPVESVYKSALGSVEEFRSRTSNPQLQELVSWFPDADKQREVEDADPDVQAGFAAEVLGHNAAWGDEVDYLHIYRPQDRTDRGTAAGDLGLSRKELGEILSMAPQVAKEFYNYTNYLIENLLKGDLSAVASKIKTIGQVLGFHQFLLARLGNPEDIQIIFKDGSPKIDDVDAALYLSEASREMPVEKASYDAVTNRFEVQVGTHEPV